MSVCSVSGIVSDSLSASGESKRQSSTRVACSEKIAKLTPTPSHVAPRGYGVPGQTRIERLGTESWYHAECGERNPEPQTPQTTQSPGPRSSTLGPPALELQSQAVQTDTLRRLAALFDSAFRIPGTRVRFGLDPILGLVPGVGDMASPVLALLLIWQATRQRVPKPVLARMVVNALVDAGVGAIPVVGDAFDFVWKANDWNLSLLERHAQPGTRATPGDWLFLGLCGLVLFGLALLPVLVVLWIGRRLI